MVVVSQSVVDGKAFVSNSAHRDGFDSGQRIHAAKTIDVAFAVFYRDSRFFKDAADL